MKATELLAAIETLFDCIDGEPRAYTRNPPRPLHLDDDTVPEEKRHWYEVFGFSSHTHTEEQLVDALWADVQVMRALCTSERPTLIWRRKPEFSEGTIDRKRFRKVSIRIVIPEISSGELLLKWTGLRSNKPEGEPFKEPV